MIKKLTLLKNEAIKQGVVELGRVALLAILPLLIVQLESGQINWKAILVAGLIALLKAIDRGIHVYGKSKENDSLALGLTRF